MQSITAENGAALSGYELEPQLITALSEDKNRTKRRLVTYQEIPPRMVQAVVAIEDRDFFNHGGINYMRTIKCGFQDLLSRHMSCGGSTLTQQLARGFFLSPEKKITRKLREIMITFQLEARFNKQQIFEMYANQMNLGHLGSYEINGFGEAAQAFFGKDLGQLDVARVCPAGRHCSRTPATAIPTGILSAPWIAATSYLTQWSRPALSPPAKPSAPRPNPSALLLLTSTPAKHPTSSISSTISWSSASAIRTSLTRTCGSIRRSILIFSGRRRSRRDRHAQRRRYRSQTPQDAQRPRARPHHVSPGLARSPSILTPARCSRSSADATTVVSQLNHAVAERPTGSIFKPFVYAAAYNSQP